MVRQVVAEAIGRRLSDPRIEPFTSVTRVSVSPDLSYADVYVSVMGSPGAARATLAGLTSAHGVIGQMLGRRWTARKCPSLRFHLDDSIKKGMETIRLIEESVGRDDEPAAEADPGSADESVEE